MRVVLANGTTVDLGKVEITPTIGITDHSRRVTDDFGVTTVVPRKFSRRMSMRLAVPNTRADEVYNQLVALRAKTATFIADERYAWLRAEGRIKEFEFAYQTGDQTYYTLSIDGIAEAEGVTDTGVDPATSGKPSAFKLVQPVSVTDAVLTSSSLAENDAPAWSASAAYAKGAVVARAHRLFESLVDSNVGADPTADAAKWLDTGPTNRWAMFDEALGTSTIASAVVEVVLKTVNAISALALLDTNAASVRVRAPGYDRTVVPNGAGQAIFLDLAVAGSASIIVTVTPAVANPGPQYWDDGAQWMDAGVWSDSLAAGDGTVTIGTFLFGELKGLGATETGVTAGITDYSRKETDEFGEVTIVERSWAKRTAAKTLIRSDALDVVADRLAAVRARPSLWIARTGADALTIYGYPKDWSIEVGQNVSKLSLSVEGLSKAAPRRTGSLGGPVDWTDLTDETGTKPTNNADKTSENTAKDTNAVGGVPAASITGRLTTLVEVTIPAVEAASAAAGQRITEARAAADLALSTIENEVERVDQRIDTLSANGGYDDTAVKAEIKLVDEVSLGRDAALGTRIGSVSALITDTDTNLRALVETKETAAVDRENAISRRVDQIIAEGGGGSEGVDTIARAEIQRVEQAAVLGQQSLAGRSALLEASSGGAVAGAISPGQNPLAHELNDFGSFAPAYDNSVARACELFPASYAIVNGRLRISNDGQAHTGPMRPIRISPGRIYRFRAVGRGVAIWGGGTLENLIACFDKDGQYLGADLRGGPAYRTDSETAVEFTVSMDPNSGAAARFGQIANFDPNRVAWARPAIIARGTGGDVTDIIEISLVDVTDAMAAGRDIAAASARIKTTEDAIADLPNRFASAQRATNIEVSLNNARGRLSEVETATTDGRFVAVQRVNDIEASLNDSRAAVSQQAGVIVGLGQKTAAYVRVIADAGNGRAALSLWSDQYGGAWQLTGNGYIDGDLTIRGSLNVDRINKDTTGRDASASWYGNAQPGPGQTIVIPWSLTLPGILPRGRFLWEYEFGLVTNANTQSVSPLDGKQLYTNYVDDGGLSVTASDGQGHAYAPRPNSSDAVLAAMPFDAVFGAAVTRGNYDSGVRNEGDYYTRDISASYQVSFIRLKATWIAF